MQIEFYKYQGTGNDFVMIDNSSLFFPKENTDLIRKICDRNFGIGSDGLILLEKNPDCDFEMVFYNPDASMSFCGNGSRCAVAFAKQLGWIGNTSTFKAIDGMHEAVITNDVISVKMKDVDEVKEFGNDFFIHTGSPHHIVYVNDVMKAPVIERGRQIRYSIGYTPAGTNVNFVEETEAGIRLRTYERGVENETLSCGTGVTAAALSYAWKHKNNGADNYVAVTSMGGKLGVRYERTAKGFRNVRLEGPATLIYKGFYDAKV